MRGDPALDAAIVVVLAAIAITVASCKERLAPTAGPTTGTCHPFHVIDGVVITQRCAWDGFWWACGGEHAANCIREAPLPVEAPR